MRYAVADVEAWAGRFRDGEHDEGDIVDCHLLLEQPTASQLSDALAHAVECLDFHFEESAGGSLNLVFSGHGSRQGDLVLADRLVSPDELMEWCAAGRAGGSGKTRHLRTVIDSCHSGLTFCRMLLHQHHWKRLVIRDGYAACLPSEEAFEIRSLAHSVLTYSMLRPGRSLVWDVPNLTGDELREVRKTLRESTQWLTNGEQHAVDMINGHSISLFGTQSGGRPPIKVLGIASLDEFTEAVDSLASRERRRR